MKEAPLNHNKLADVSGLFGKAVAPVGNPPSEAPAIEPSIAPTSDPQSGAKPKAHYLGHRDRLRQKIIERGVDALEDYELLETLLFAFIPRRDVKPISKALLTRFGGLGGVLSASAADLVTVQGVGDSCASYLKTVDALRHRAARETIIKRPLLNSWAAIVQYVKSRLEHEAREHFLILYIDKKNQLIDDSVHSIGTIDHSPVFPRELTKSVLDKGASAIVLVHNHPSGDPTPSRADIDITRHLMDILSPFDVEVHDHLVVGKHGVTSLKSAGLI